MITAIDTNLLIGVVGESSEFYKESSDLLEQHSAMGTLIISPVVHSELLAVFFKQWEEQEAVRMMQRFLADSAIRIFDFSNADFVLAARVWSKFRSLGKVICPKCGAANEFTCKKCS